MSPWSDPLARAYEACEMLARAHYENFPVASHLLPKAMRPHIAAVYAFARVADDIADEGNLEPADRRYQLRMWQDRVHQAAAGQMAAGDAADRDDQIALAVGHSIRSLGLPLDLFDDLLSAFGQDTMTTRYDSWADVFEYCRRSANPVGRLVLRIAGYQDAALDRSSDALCTALQLTNFWQDFGRDWEHGRLYVPRHEQIANQAVETDLSQRDMTPAWGQTIARCVDVTRGFFQDGRHVCDSVRGRLRIELRATWLGGARVLDRVQQARQRLLHYRPVLGAVDAPVLIWRLVGWRAAAGAASRGDRRS